MKSNCMLSSDAVARSAEVVELLRVRQVDLAEQDRVARARLQEAPQVAQVLVRIAEVDALGQLDEERHRVDTEPRDAELEPEPEQSSRSRRAPRGLAMFRSGCWR